MKICENASFKDIILTSFLLYLDLLLSSILEFSSRYWYSDLSPIWLLVVSYSHCLIVSYVCINFSVHILPVLCKCISDLSPKFCTVISSDDIPLRHATIQEASLGRFYVMQEASLERLVSYHHLFRLSTMLHLHKLSFCFNTNKNGYIHFMWISSTM